MVGIAGVVVVLSRCCRSRRDSGSRGRCRLAGSRAGDAKRRGFGDDERPRRPRDRHHQAGARPQPGRRPAGRLGRALRDRRSATKIDGHARQRAAAWRRANRSAGAPGAADCRRPDVQVRHERGDRRPRGRRPVCRAGPRIGVQVRARCRWKIVGIFTSNGSVAETEIWCDGRVLQGAYRRGNSYQSVLARLDSPARSTPSRTG